MISDEIKLKIESLFAKKKYEEVINITEKFIKKEERPAGLASLIGSCYSLKKNKLKKDLILSLDFFEEAYLKGKISVNGLSGVTNFINISTVAAKKSYEFLPHIYKAEKFYNETSKYFDKNPDFLVAAYNLFWFQLDNIKLKEITQKIMSTPGVPLRDRSGSIFFQNYIYSWSQEKYTEQVKINSKSFDKYKVKETNINENNKFHIGFVSCDFTDQHSIFSFIKETLEHLDRKIFKIFLFSFNRGINNELGQEKIKSVADEFIELDDFNNQECVNLIQEKNIDILIDVMGYTYLPRVQIFNSRVSKIQISWLATCNTAGIDNIDYLIADDNVIPDHEEKLYPEKIIKLPNIWNVHSGFDLERKFSPSPCENKNFFTFGSLNNYHKISDEVVQAWAKILRKCENSKLLLKSSSMQVNQESIVKKFKMYDLEDKLIILSSKNYPHKKDHLKVYNDIDLALDTFPYNGVTTTFEALWMGVPVLVLKGFNFNSKCGFSIIKNSSFTDLISNDLDEYTEKAIYFYNNREKFLQLKKELFNNILSTPLFDTKNFSKNLSDKLLDILKKHDLKSE